MGNDKSRSKSVESVQEFLPFEGIDEDCLIIEGGNTGRSLNALLQTMPLKQMKNKLALK